MAHCNRATRLTAGLRRSATLLAICAIAGCCCNQPSCGDSRSQSCGPSQVHDQRCSADGSAVQYCFYDESGGVGDWFVDLFGIVSWHERPCRAPTDRCVEHGKRAMCVGQVVSKCTAAAPTEPRCKDAHTLTQCKLWNHESGAGVRWTSPCPKGQRCTVSGGEAQCATPRKDRYVAALLAYTRGDVHEVVAGKGSSKPSAPSVVPRGAKLKVGPHALAVVLVKERAIAIHGPRTVVPDELQPTEPVPSRGDTELISVLSDIARHSGTRRGAAHDASGKASASAAQVRLIRPVPEPHTRHLTLHVLDDGRSWTGSGLGARKGKGPVIRWRCNHCGEQEVVIRDTSNDKVVWRGMGTNQVVYDGVGLWPGEYVLQIGDSQLYVKVENDAKFKDTVSLANTWASQLVIERVSKNVAFTVARAVLLWHARARSALAYMFDQRVASHPDDHDLARLRDLYFRAAAIPNLTPTRPSHAPK